MSLQHEFDLEASNLNQPSSRSFATRVRAGTTLPPLAADSKLPIPAEKLVSVKALIDETSDLLTSRSLDQVDSILL